MGSFERFKPNENAHIGRKPPRALSHNNLGGVLKPRDHNFPESSSHNNLEKVHRLNTTKPENLAVQPDAPTIHNASSNLDMQKTEEATSSQRNPYHIVQSYLMQQYELELKSKEEELKHTLHSNLKIIGNNIKHETFDKQMDKQYIYDIHDAFHDYKDDKAILDQESRKNYIPDELVYRMLDRMTNKLLDRLFSSFSTINDKFKHSPSDRRYKQDFKSAIEYFLRDKTKIDNIRQEFKNTRKNL